MNLSHWPFAALGATCGFIAVLGVWLYRGFWRKQWVLSLPTALVVFLSAGALPTALVFFLYPFPIFDPKPDLKDHLFYLPVAGFGLFWIVLVSIKYGIDNDNPSTPELHSSSRDKRIN